MTDRMIVLVTGANKGIGREIAAQLAQLGHTVIIGARNLERGEQAAAELRALGGTVTAVALDVTDAASVAAAAEKIAAEHGHLDALVNNAGISHQPGADFAGQLPARPTSTTSGTCSRPTCSGSSASPARSCRCCASPAHRAS